MKEEQKIYGFRDNVRRIHARMRRTRTLFKNIGKKTTAFESEKRNEKQLEYTK